MRVTQYKDLNTQNFQFIIYQTSELNTAKLDRELNTAKLDRELNTAKLDNHPAVENCNHLNDRGGSYREQQNLEVQKPNHEGEPVELQKPNQDENTVVRSIHLKYDNDVPQIRLIYTPIQCTLRSCQTTGPISITHQTTLSLLCKLLGRALSIVRNNHFLVGYHIICIRFRVPFRIRILMIITIT